MNFEEAIDFSQKFGNKWRLPTIEELYSLIPSNSQESDINSLVFPDLKDMEEYAPYWSISPVENMPRLIYYLDFIHNQVDAHSKGFTMLVRLVRSQENNE